MSQHEVRVCDYPTGKTVCGMEADTFSLWRAGERNAWSLDLCEKHASKLDWFFASAELDNLPAKPRARMELTPLKTTSATRKLKKRP